MLGMGRGKEDQARRTVEERFGELFVETPEGFKALYETQLRGLLVTWETC
jgi:hypothetical protein